MSDEQLTPPADDIADLEQRLRAAKGDSTPPLNSVERMHAVQAGPPEQDKVAAAAADAAKDDDPAEETGNAVVLIDRLDVATLDEKWPHQWLEFKGDNLGIRHPTRAALGAFSLASSRYVNLGVKNDLTGLFIARHLSPESYGRVFSRLMDPDETDYDVDTVGELFGAIVTAAMDADKGDDTP